ncbi:MAG: PQQ-binding-like beta-propeller repeat protein [Fuerstiella sp.]|nr:PQQ-binding-like beta-propeller repeat protein [Fuerstiella sp.]MDG2130308.1 PQQ-binding-like beta-propeller repeat protein [Fuerstiella sp.]
MHRLTRYSTVTLSGLLSFASIAAAENWPTWRHDAGRTNITAEKIPAPLHLQWTRQLPPVTPAFRKSRLQFDQGYEPIVMGDTVYVSLPHIDAVIAYAVETGKEKWRFYTAGPVRLAPVAWRNKLYFGSDDGHLYCLNASDGALQWKFRAVPSARKLLGNGRLISVWPIRGGPVLADETVYFAAGVWPLEGVFVYALDAQSGQVEWLNDRCGTLYGKQPHAGAEALGGLSPQGYLLINGDELLVPCGAARPATFNRHSGELLDFTLPTEGTVPGGWFVRMDPQLARDIRRGKIEFDSVVNRDQHEGGLRTGKGVAGSRTQVMLGGSLLKYASGVNGVDGDIHSVVAANGRLFVTTRDGTIYCFGDTEVSPTFHLTQPALKPHVDEALASTIAHLRTLTSVRDGYALVLGTRDGRLAEQLAATTNFHVIALAPIESDAESLRRRILDPAAPAGRLSIVAGELEEVAFPQYLADLIVAEDWGATRLKTGADFLLTLYERLKPYGGVACLAVEPTRDEEIHAWLRAAGHSEARIERRGDLLLIRRAGALPGAVDYTKDWSAPDARVRAPLGILWFDDSLTHFKRAPQPSIVGGVMISQDKDWQGKVERMGPVNHLHRDGTGRFRLLNETFMDVYTGRVLSRDEAESRLERAPKTRGADFRPPYQYRPPYVEAHLQELQSRGEKPKSYPFLRQADKGQMTNPLTGVVEPRCYVKSYGCDGGVDYGHLITMRSACPAFYDKRIESGTISIAGPRSGCTNSVIPANGVLNMPYFYEGCTCSYPLPTGAALISMPQTFEQWTAWGQNAAGPIVRIGVNLGAPGDRMTHGGTLFLDYPSVGGPSPEIKIQTQPATLDYFYHHSLFTHAGQGWPWVCASGAQGIKSLRLTELKSGSYTVRFYFVEPRHTAAGARVFDVALQGTPVLTNFDIFVAAQGRMKCLVKEFTDVQLDGECTLSFTAHKGRSLLSGIELVSTGLPLDPLPDRVSDRQIRFPDD